ncbi:Rv3235 family protein [Streptomyces sp. NPDC006367]|uniref:Rv3235 family protein n=1 Tax=unclassified Streptomyces TaxID=2593676 RepID=UPI0033B335A8
MQPTPTVPPLRKVMTRTRPRPLAQGPSSGVAAVPPHAFGAAPVRGAGDAGGAFPADPRARADAGRPFPASRDSHASRDASPRTPGGVPPRRPGDSGVRAAAPGGRPPGSPGRSPRTRTRPADTRPAATGPGGRSRTSARPAGVTPVPDRTASAARRIAASPPPPPAPASAAAPVVPAQAPRRPVPQLRPTDHFAELLLDVLTGRRPVHSMLRHTVGRAYDELARLAERGPLRTRGPLPVVRDIGYFEPRPGALEVFARIGAGDQLRAMAFRLEQGQDLRWRCTAVELGGRRAPRTDDD